MSLPTVRQVQITMSINSKKILSEIAKELCRDLRKRSTKAESILWEELRNRKLYGKKFLRQHPLFYDIHGKESFFIADYYCHENKLIIELDGEYHKYRLTEDEQRTEILNLLGLKVIRFSNKEIEMSIHQVIEAIKKNL